MQFPTPLFTLRLLVICSFVFALPLSDDILASNSTAIHDGGVIHRLGPRDVLCEPWTFPQAKCHVFTLSYQEDGTNFIAGFDSRCTPISAAKNVPLSTAQYINVGDPPHMAITWFVDWIISPRVQYILPNGQLGNYGLGFPGTVHCENGNNDDTGLYCITAFPC
jgi:hypothetical protein